MRILRLLAIVVCALAVGRAVSADELTATITAPVDGAVNADVTQPIQWTSVPNPQAYFLYVGTTVGAKDLVSTGEIQTTFYLITKQLPANQTLHARIYTKVGGIWRYTDSTFSAAPLTATITAPVNGATGADITQPIQWTSVPNVQAYFLYVGTTLGAKDLVSTGEIQATSYLITKQVPANQTLYLRIHAKIGGVWRYTDSTFSAAPLTATIAAPVNGATAADVTQPIQWTSVPNAQAYFLYLGTTLGAKDLVSTGEIQTTSFLVTKQLPSNQTLYLRINTKVGGVWRYTDSTFIAAPLTATITAPVNGATNADVTQPIQWTSVANAQAYFLYVGTTIGATDLVSTGEIQATSYLVTKQLPSNQALYLRINTKVGGVWRYTDSTFSAAPLTSTITSPVNGATGADVTLPIQWTSVPNVQAYFLYVGTTVGAKDLVNTGELQQTSYLVTSALPANQTLYVRINTKVGGVWRYTDSTFSAAPLTSTITAPVNGATNVDVTQPIQWTSVPNAQAYFLYVGTTVGARNLVNTGELPQTSYLVTSALPPNQTLYVRINTKVGGVWRYTDSTFSAAPLTASLMYPTAGAVDADSTRPIQWTTVQNAQAYYLYVGTTPGARDLVDTGETQQTSYAANNLPGGQTIYARIYARVGYVWRYTESTFTVVSLAAQFSSPLAGAQGVTTRTPFTWAPVSNADAYFVYLGTSPGSGDIVASGELIGTSYRPASLPANTTVHARLYTLFGGVWRHSPEISFLSGTLTSRFVFPARGSVAVELNQPFQWTPVADAAGYRLVVASTPGGSDLLDTGTIQQTTFPVASLPVDGVIYARVYTLLDGTWRFSDTVFTLMPAGEAANLTAPLDGATGIDAGQPFQWTAAGLASGYRLELGTAPGTRDLHDSGLIRITRRFVPNLPLGSTVYGRLSTLIGEQWVSRDFVFSAGANAIATDTKMTQALWATHAVWSMAPLAGAPLQGMPEIGAELSDVLSSKALSQPVCADYALELKSVLEQMNIGSPVRIMNVAFNPNGADGHTLVQLQSDDTGRWMLLDPTFDLTVLRTADGAWATAEEVSAATRSQQWGDVSYMFLGPAGDQWVRQYYIDYPLLFVNTYQQGQPTVNGVGATILPYIAASPLPAAAGPQMYAVGCVDVVTAEVLTDGATRTLDCAGVDGISRAFYANAVGATGATPATMTLYRLLRFVF